MNTVNYNLPDFIIIGAAKSGTTSLFSQLRDDDRFFLCNPKEPEFFARDELFEKGLDWYSNLYKDAAENQLKAEASTLYSLYPLFPKTAQRIHSAVPDVKLVYVMRNPVSRAYSYYVQLVKNFQNANQTSAVPYGFEDLLRSKDPCRNNSANLAGFDSHLPFCPDLLIAGGMYFSQISEYLKYFNRDAMHFMVFEDLISNPEESFRKLFHFLGVKYLENKDEFSLRRENIANDHFSNIYTNDVMGRFSKLPFAKAFPEKIKNLVRDAVKNRHVSKLFTSNYKPSPMSSETRDYLKKLYVGPTVNLSEFLGRDMLKFWKLES